MKNNIKLLYISPSLCFSALLLTACTSAPPVAGDGQSPSDNTNASSEETFEQAGEEEGAQAREKAQERARKEDIKQLLERGKPSMQESDQVLQQAFERPVRETPEPAQRSAEERLMENFKSLMEDFKKNDLHKDLAKAHATVEEARATVEKASGWVKQMNTWGVLLTNANNSKMYSNCVLKVLEKSVKEVNKGFEEARVNLDKADQCEKKALSASISDDPRVFVSYRDLVQKTVWHAQKAIEISQPIGIQLYSMNGVLRDYKRS